MLIWEVQRSLCWEFLTLHQESAAQGRQTQTTITSQGMDFIRAVLAACTKATLQGDPIIRIDLGPIQRVLGKITWKVYHYLKQVVFSLSETPELVCAGLETGDWFTFQSYWVWCPEGESLIKTALTPHIMPVSRKQYICIGLRRELHSSCLMFHMEGPRAPLLACLCTPFNPTPTERQPHSVTGRSGQAQGSPCCWPTERVCYN
jgi:hypothetical protein